MKDPVVIIWVPQHTEKGSISPSVDLRLPAPTTKPVVITSCWCKLQRQPNSHVCAAPPFKMHFHISVYSGDHPTLLTNRAAQSFFTAALYSGVET